VLVRNTRYAQIPSKLIEDERDSFKSTPLSIIPLSVLCQGLPRLKSSRPLCSADSQDFPKTRNFNANGHRHGASTRLTCRGGEVETLMSRYIWRNQPRAWRKKPLANALNASAEYDENFRYHFGISRPITHICRAIIPCRGIHKIR